MASALAAGINKGIAEKLGAKYAKLAKDLEAGIQGRYIRNVQDAEKTYEQLTKGLNKKLKAQDKAAIVAWLKRSMRNSMPAMRGYWARRLPAWTGRLKGLT